MKHLIKYCFAIAIAFIVMHHPITAQAEEPKPGRKLTITVNGVDFVFCYIPAGSFMMGSPESEKGRGEDEKLHKVIISKPFYMMEHEVTQKQFGKEPNGKLTSKGDYSHFRGAKLPIENQGFPDATYSRLAKELMKATGKKFRLPTDAEWEYACRAGTTTPFNCGKDLDSTMANIDGYYPYGNGVKGKLLNKTMEVKQFKPNAWGLYDMHGNVAELCIDYVAKGVDLSVDGITDPGAADPEAIKIASIDSSANGLLSKLNWRGGSYWSSGSECRSAAHDNTVGDHRNGGDFLGFRLVLIP